MSVEELQTVKKQIFIVDDDESVRRALKLLMMTYGFEVDTFASFEDFLSDIPNSLQGCLILDIYMPGLDGWEGQRILIKSGSDRPVIFITADKNNEFKEKAVKVGAKGLLQKPFNDQELVDLINSAFLSKD